MRIPVLLVAFVSFLAAPAGRAQQAVPDAPAPQGPPARKQTTKPAGPPPAAPKDGDNAFPEDQSKAAADAANQKKQPPDNENAFPEDQSKAAADEARKKQPPVSQDNPFPEAESKAAAKAAGGDMGNTPVVPVHDPARSKKDDEVGRFYLDKGDYKGALLRYQDATATDPTNVNAIFGLAESQHYLKQNAEALKNYELYLRIVPNGPKAKQALKGLKEIGEGK